MGKAGAERDFHSIPTGPLFGPEQPLEATTELASEPATPEDPRTPPKPVVEIMADHEARLEERAARLEQMDSNWPQSRINEALDREFPDLREPKRVEELEVQQDAALRRQAKHSVPPKPPRVKTRQGLSSRGLLMADGPPPHIARQNRGEE